MVHSKMAISITGLNLICSVLCVISIFSHTQSENLDCPSSCSCLGQFVDCSKQGLLRVPTDIPIWAENLELSNNAISHLYPDKFQHLTKLLQLDLSSNHLRDNSTDVLRKLPLLSVLKLSKNLLTEVPMFSGAPSLEHLSLSHNKIHTLKRQALENLLSLKTLDLDGNRLYKLTEHYFPNNSAIQNLNLNNNRISAIEKGSLDNLKNLLELKMNRNHLSRFSKELFKHLKHLKILELSRNRFTEIEGLSFLGLSNLNILKMQRNAIHTLLDGAFWGLQNMTILQLDHNNITTVTKGWLYGLASLRQLTLNNNNIKEIDEDGWEFCQQLVVLDLSNNKMESIGKETLEHLGKLQRLRLDNNNIAYIADGAFNYTTSLEILELNGNRISWTVEDMTGAFLGLSRLLKFGLAANQVKSINRKAFVGLERLEQLDLFHNNITSIQENAFAAMPHLNRLMINTSSLLCDCNMQWFPPWLGKTSLSSTITATCAYPLWLKGERIEQLLNGNFTCGEYPIPQIIEDPKTQIALKGENVTLQCKANSSTEIPMSFVWKKDNLDITNGNVRQFARNEGGKASEQSSQLLLTNISHVDAGKYQCVVTNSFGTTYSPKSKITVLIFPTFAKTPGNVTVKSGTNARLECAARGQPPPQIAWRKDGGNDFPAARQRRMHFMPADDVFFIINVGISDTGVYSCTAQNLAGVIVANASLLVEEPPSFVKPMENKEITAGEPIVLECMASGSPKPRLTWTKDGDALLVTERHFFTADDQLLIIVDTALADAGTYECSMSNSLGTQAGVTHLSVVPASGAETDMAGIIIMTVVCCAVGTSVVWVVIIYQTRKRLGRAQPAKQLPEQSPETDLLRVDSRLFLDDDSETSSGKDSGTGDSAKRSDDHLLLVGGTDLDLSGACSEDGAMEMAESAHESEHRTGHRTEHRTDHDRCCDCVAQRWSAPHYSGQHDFSKTCSYHSLQNSTPAPEVG